MKLPLANPLTYRRMEVSVRVCNEGPTVSLTKPEHVAAFAHALQDSPQEIMLWIGVDCRKRVVAVQELFRGTVDACMVHPREVFRSALLMAPTVCGVFLVHNHPSGSCQPSTEDVQFYDRVSKAGKLLHIPVIDCLIVAENGAWSQQSGTLARPASAPDVHPEPACTSASHRRARSILRDHAEFSGSTWCKASAAFMNFVMA